MDGLPKSRLLRFVEQAMMLARRAVERFSTCYWWRRFTLRQHVDLLCLKVKKTTTYRDLVDELISDEACAELTARVDDGENVQTFVSFRRRPPTSRRKKSMRSARHRTGKTS